MKYKVTKQFASGGSEVFFAEFHELNDARLFIENLSNVGEEIIYKLLEKDKLPRSISVPFRVLVRISATTEIILGQFHHINDANQFITMKLRDDAQRNVDETYYLLDEDKFVEKSDQTTLAAVKNSKSNKNMIRPSPLSMRLRPRGAGHGMYNTGDDDDDDKK
jgi:hypothetical protein